MSGESNYSGEGDELPLLGLMGEATAPTFNSLRGDVAQAIEEAHAEVVTLRVRMGGQKRLGGELARADAALSREDDSEAVIKSAHEFMRIARDSLNRGAPSESREVMLLVSALLAVHDRMSVLRAAELREISDLRAEAAKSRLEPGRGLDVSDDLPVIVQIRKSKAA